MNIQRYTLPAIALHWAQAVIVLWLLWLGWTMNDLPKGPNAAPPTACTNPSAC